MVTSTSHNDLIVRRMSGKKTQQAERERERFVAAYLDKKCLKSRLIIIIIISNHAPLIIIIDMAAKLNSIAFLYAAHQWQVSSDRLRFHWLCEQCYNFFFLHILYIIFKWQAQVLRSMCTLLKRFFYTIDKWLALVSCGTGCAHIVVIF